MTPLQGKLTKRYCGFRCWNRPAHNFTTFPNWSDRTRWKLTITLFPRTKKWIHFKSIYYKYASIRCRWWYLIEPCFIVLCYVHQVNFFVGAFYDGVHLLGMALNETLTKKQNIRDGKAITSLMWNRTFNGEIIMIIIINYLTVYFFTAIISILIWFYKQIVSNALCKKNIFSWPTYMCYIIYILSKQTKKKKL